MDRSHVQIFRGSRVDAAGTVFYKHAPPDWRSDAWKPRYDAAESMFIELALTAIEAQPYNTLVPPMKGRKFVPVDGTDGPGAIRTRYMQYTRTGVARLVTERAKDVPLVGLFVKTFDHNYYPVSAGYEYSYFDLLAIGFALSKGQPINLELELSIAAREAIEKKLDIIAAWGSASAGTYGIEIEEDVGLVGLINVPGASGYTVATGAGGGTTWASKTPMEIYLDLVGVVSYQATTTYEVHIPDTILVPTSQLHSDLQRPIGEGGITKTILEFFLDTQRAAGNPMTVDSWQYLAGAGAGPTDMMIAYKRDPRMARHKISMEATPLPPSREGVMTQQILAAKTAGLVVPYPLSITRAIGI